MNCTKCGEERSLDFFSWRSKAAGIHKKRCKDCDKIYHLNYYLKNRSQEIKRSALNTTKTRHRNRELLYQFFLTHACVDCGDNDPLVLEFDHVRGEKKFNVANMVLRGFSWQTILLEIGKCEVRCANCHRRKTAKQFGWFKSLAGVA